MISFQETKGKLKRVRSRLYSRPFVQARINAVAKATDFLPPFMITSSGSSGSHLLGILLDSHSMIAVGPEVYLLNKKEIFQDYSIFQQNIQFWLADGLATNDAIVSKRFLVGTEYYGWDRRLLPFLAEETTSTRQFLDTFFGSFLLKRGKKMWGEKLPGNVNCIKEFLEIYPEGKIIHLVRDGRDATVSLLKRNIPIEKAAETWLYSNSLALEWVNDRRFLLVKYEDLVKTPNEVLARIQGYLGVAEEDLVQHRESNQYWQRVIRTDQNDIHSTWNFNPLLSPISDSSVGSYRQGLSADDLKMFCGYTKEQSQLEFPKDANHSVDAMLSYFGYQ